MGLPENPSSRHNVEIEDDSIAAVHHETDSGRWIFFCHGFGSNKEGSYERRCKYFQERGFNCVRFDFRGNGDSDGEFIEQTLSSRIQDLKAVIEHFEPEDYVLFGSSFGGKAVLHAASDLAPEALYLKAPVTYNSVMDKFRAVVEEKGRFEYIDGKPIDERFVQDLDSYSFSEVSEGIEIPVTIFHGGSDTTVHPENSFEAAQGLDTDVSIHKFKDERHSFSDNAERRMKNIISQDLDLRYETDS